MSSGAIALGELASIGDAERMRLVHAAVAAQEIALRAKLDHVLAAEPRELTRRSTASGRDGRAADGRPCPILRRHAGLEDRELDLEVAVAQQTPVVGAARASAARRFGRRLCGPSATSLLQPPKKSGQNEREKGSGLMMFMAGPHSVSGRPGDGTPVKRSISMTSVCASAVTLSSSSRASSSCDCTSASSR